MSIVRQAVFRKFRDVHLVFDSTTSRFRSRIAQISSPRRAPRSLRWAKINPLQAPLAACNSAATAPTALCASSRSASKMRLARQATITCGTNPVRAPSRPIPLFLLLRRSRRSAPAAICSALASSTPCSRWTSSRRWIAPSTPRPGAILLLPCRPSLLRLSFPLLRRTSSPAAISSIAGSQAASCSSAALRSSSVAQLRAAATASSSREPASRGGSR
jgi:hypothetical protein